jgi:hypothetical protein
MHYSLASEEGVRGKFNLNNYCLQIDDEGKGHRRNHQPNKKNHPCPSPDLERLEPWGIIWGMVFNFWRIQNPHKHYTFDFRGLPLSAMPGYPGCKVYLQLHQGYDRKKNGHPYNDAVKI